MEPLVNSMIQAWIQALCMGHLGFRDPMTGACKTQAPACIPYIEPQSVFCLATWRLGMGVISGLDRK